MTSSQARTSSLKVNTSVILLEGNEIIDLFEIDVSSLLISVKNSSSYHDEKIFRFHNSIKIFNGDSKIHFGPDSYIALPISADGFESTTRGSPPTPKLSMAVRGDGNKESQAAFATFKFYLRDFGDLIGAKVTRIRTFSRHLARRTWFNIDPKDLPVTQFGPLKSLTPWRKDWATRSIGSVPVWQDPTYGNAPLVDVIRYNATEVINNLFPNENSATKAAYIEHMTNGVFSHPNRADWGYDNPRQFDDYMTNTMPVWATYPNFVGASDALKNEWTKGVNTMMNLTAYHLIEGFAAESLIDSNYPQPSNYDPDENAIISKEVYFIDRKSLEDKNNLEFELSTLLDLQQISIPLRIVMEKTCGWQYRGEGCCYEAVSRKDAKTHGKAALIANAPPVADEKDLLFSKSFQGITLSDKGLWSKLASYSKGNYVRVKVDGLNYYFVCIQYHSTPAPPPNDTFWVQDQCTKTIESCKLRWGPSGEAEKQAKLQGSTLADKKLRFGGFPGIIKR